MTEAVERIRKEVGKNSIPVAFDLLEAELKKANRDEELNQLTTLRSDYAAISRKQIIGVATHVDEARRREIIYQILVLAGELLTPEPKENKSSANVPKTNPVADLSPEGIPELIRIVIITANPKDTFALPNINDEIKAIIQAVKVSDSNCKKRFAEPHTRLSAQLVDLIKSLISIRPHIIHFVGHGSAEGNLILQAKDDHSLELSPEQLLRLLKQVHERSPLLGVVFNLCHSHTLMEQSAKLFDYVIGWKGELPDSKGKFFAEGFYESLAAEACKSGELDFPLAFEMGRVVVDVMMEGSEGEVSLGGRKVGVNK